MFDWFWKFLYQISKLLFWVSDLMMDAAMRLCGIQPVTFNGEETDFLTYLIQSDDIQWAYAALSVIAVAALFVMTIVAILISLSKVGEANAATPMQIFMKACKSMLMFLFVPGVLVVFTAILNVFMIAIYQATLRGGSSIGSYLFVVFCNEARLTDDDAWKFLRGEYSYTDTSRVCDCIEISDFQFILSWIVGAVCVYHISAVLIQFVDRAIEICILFLASPFCIASSVLDEGARFKTWKDQVISKYLGAYGAIVAINIYCMVCSAVVNANFYFSSKAIINDVCKVLIILGGASTMRKAMVMVATLVSQTAAADMNDPSFKGNAFGSAMGKLAGAAAAVTGLSSIGKGIAGKFNDVTSSMGRGIRAKLGLTTNEDREKEAALAKLNQGNDKEEKGSSDSKNEEKPEQFNDQNSLNKALEGGEKDENDNDNNKKAEGNGQNMVNNALQGGEAAPTDNDKKEGE